MMGGDYAPAEAVKGVLAVSSQLAADEILVLIGDEEKIKLFIRETKAHELGDVLNCCPYEQWYGNCLHMLLFWNTGDKAITLFKLLDDHGARYIRNYYGLYPWQINASSWFVPFGNVNLGVRDKDEFRDTYAALVRMYSFDDLQKEQSTSYNDSESEFECRP